MCLYASVCETNQFFNETKIIKRNLILSEKKHDLQNVKDLESKWGARVNDNGWSAIPRTLLLNQKALNLKFAEMTVLINLVSEWWAPGSEIFPSIKTLADRTGTSEQYIRKVLKMLESKEIMVGNIKLTGLIKVIPRRTDTGSQTSNVYNLEPLQKALTTIQLSRDLEKSEAHKERALARARALEVHKQHEVFLEENFSLGQ